MVFGGGSRGVEAIKMLERLGVEITAIIDNDADKQGSIVNSIPVISPNDISSREQPVLIASHYDYEIFEQLLGMGFDSRIISFFKTEVNERVDQTIYPYVKEINAAYFELADEESRMFFRQALQIGAFGYHGPAFMAKYPQYDHPNVCVEPGDTILDVGGLYGETAIFFANKTNRKCMVYSFEPSPAHVPHILDAVNTYKDCIEVVKLGAWSKKTRLNFNAQHKCIGAHRIEEDGPDEISVIDLDTFVENRSIKIDLIKMDIEGAEMKALIGAQTIIRRFRPKLQISIYHGINHLWEIINYISDLRCNYTFNIGHHSKWHTETILYAKSMSKSH